MSDNLKKVNKFLTAIGCRDLKAISSVCRDDFVYEVASKSIEFNTLKGDEAFLFLSVMSGEFYQDMTFDYQIIRSVETLELMVVELEVSAKTTSDHQFNNSYVMWFDFDEGKISKLTEHTDTLYSSEVLSHTFT